MLSDAIRDCYQEWIDAAPPEYKQTLCGSSLPLSISSKHGQNRKIWADDFSINEEEQRQFWNNSVDLRYIHIYRVAFALHLQFVSSLLTSYPMVAGTKGLVPCANLAQGPWSKILLTNTLACGCLE